MINLAPSAYELEMTTLAPPGEDKFHYLQLRPSVTYSLPAGVDVKGGVYLRFNSDVENQYGLYLDLQYRPRKGKP